MGTQSTFNVDLQAAKALADAALAEMVKYGVPPTPPNYCVWYNYITKAIAGFLEAARAARHDIVPLLWCSASPSAHVERDAYERIAGRLLSLIKNAGPLDGLYLDLHGAMVTEHL